MASGNAESGVRIVKRGKKGHGGHHGGAWKVAYADFVTALMAFFLVMWIVGMSKPVREAVSGYFKDPSGYMKAVAAGENALGKKGAGGSSLIALKEKLPDKPVPNTAEQERKRFEEAKANIQKFVKQYPEFKDLAESIRVTITHDGMRVDLVESSQDMFFDSGSALTKPRTKKLLARVAKELGKLPNRVVIEGHTDSLPYSGPNGWTNWELSTARANAARYTMDISGLRKGQVLEVRGLADRLPIDAKHPESFKNRRVSILLPYDHHVKRISTGL